HEARQHVYQGGLATAGSPYQGDRLARLDLEGHLADGVAIRIGEALRDGAELDLAAYRLRKGTRTGVDFGFLVDQREDAFAGDQHFLHLARKVGQALDGVEDLGQRGHERGKAAHRERAAVGLAERDRD